MSRRLLGVLGGAFNPPHFGHLRAALEAREGLGLTKVLLVPSGRHPFKGADVLADADHRWAMTRLACGGDGGLEACDIEVKCPTTAYTVETLAEVAVRHPDSEIVFLLGSDLLRELHLWKSWQGLLGVAHLCQMLRPGVTVGADISGDVAGWLRQNRRSDLHTAPGEGEGRFGFVQLPVTRLAISSSDIRRRVRAGGSIRYLTPESVVAYIQAHGLYRDNFYGPGVRGQSVG